MNIIGLSSFDKEEKKWQTPEYDEPIVSSFFLSPSAYSAIDMAGVVVINSNYPVFEIRNIGISIIVFSQGGIDV